MLKKFLLSLVLEKFARERLENIQEAKKKAPQVSPPGKTPPSKKPPEKTLSEKLDEGAAKLSEPDQLFDALKRLEEALDDGILNQPTSPPPQEVRLGSDGKKISPERAALISQALATQRKKEKLLDNLDPEVRLKLHLMAKKIMPSG